MKSNTNNTIWDLAPHTAAKHKILERYLQAWMPILSRWHSDLNYIDGFAGPGIYSKGEEGSPLIALRTAVGHETQLASVSFTFVECREDRAMTLKKVLGERYPKLPKNFKCEVICGEFADVMNGVFDSMKKGQTLAPSFVFIDPFGLKGFPMSLVARILNCPRCEVLVTFMEGFIVRFSGKLFADIHNELFGTPKWREVNKKRTTEERKNFLLELYQNQLKRVPRCYARSFEMKDEKGRTIYYLVYATKHEKGMEVMKEAMWKVDPTGMYRFSDRTNPRQHFLLDYMDEAWWGEAASRDVNTQFKGRTVPLETLRKFVILETPWLFRKRPILERLEKRGKIINVRPRQRKFTYPDGCEITFA